MSVERDRLDRRGAEYLGVVLLMAVAAFLALYNLSGYPSLESHDEGYRLRLAKDIARHQRWTVETSEGFAVPAFDVTGPPVMAIIVGVFRMFGTSLWAARVVMSCYLIAAIVACYLCARFLYGPRVGLLASLLFLVAGPSWQNSVSFGRSVYGEMPALAFAFLGYFLWFQALRSNGARTLAGASASFALSTLTRSPMALPIGASLMGAWLVRRGAASIAHRLVLIPLVCALVGAAPWMLFQWLNDPSSFGDEGIVGFSGTRMSPFVPHLWFENAKYLVQNGFILWAMPATAHTMLGALRNDAPHGRMTQIVFPVFVTVATGWYVIASIGWPRYAYPAWAVSAILVAKLLVDLRVATPRAPAVAAHDERLHMSYRIRQLPIVLLIAFVVLWPLQNTVRRVLQGDNNAAIEFAGHVDAIAPRDARILSEEWEVDFLTNRSYLHVPSMVIENHIAKYQLGSQTGDADYDPAAVRPDFVIDGPYNKGTGFIPRDFLTQHCRLRASAGPYDLYEVLQ